ncbi:MAG: hypothetical protein ACPH5T_06515, partial [Candidatus Poseidoniaceae archaeon]
LLPVEKEEVSVKDRDFVTDGPAFIPLPGKENQNEPAGLLRDSSKEFVSDGPAHIPLPDLPELDDEIPEPLPEMPVLDDLPTSADVPQMPNLDDLF